MIKSDQINELAAALSKAQSEIRGAIKDSSNPFFKSNYADLASCWEAIRQPLAKNGLSISQIMDGSELTTMLMHSSGQFLSGSVPIISAKQDPQSIGAATTYYRRFALSAIIGLIQVDDDGNQASGKVNIPPTFTQPASFTSISSTTFTNDSRKITEKQAKLFWAKALAAGWTKDYVRIYLKDTFDITETKDIPASDFNDVLAYIEDSSKQEDKLPAF